VTFAGSIPGETQTLPVAIYTVLQRADGEQAALRLALLSVLVSVARPGGHRMDQPPRPRPEGRMSLSLHVRARRGDFDLDVAFETDVLAVGLDRPLGRGQDHPVAGAGGADTVGRRFG
jgi:hypothetical protein